MNTHDLLFKGLQSLIEAGIAVLVPVIVHYVLTKISKAKLEKNANLAMSVVKAVQVASGVNVDVTKIASDKLASLTKGKLTSEEIDHLIGAAMYEIQKDTVQALQSSH